MQGLQNSDDGGTSSLSQYTPVTSTQLLSSLEDFDDVATWINSLLDGDTDLEDVESAIAQEQQQHRDIDLANLDQRVSQLSAAFKIASEDISAQLERTIDQISRTVPRLTYDLQFMRENALSLQVALHVVESQSSSSISSNETTEALQRLHYLDTVKRNMESSLGVLREAESWSSLESEVVSFFAEGAYSRAAARLSEASKSLTVFENTPEYGARKSLLVSLQNQLEASLSTALVTAINNRDTDACKSFFEIFCSIEREAEFRGYWNGIKRQPLVESWEGAVVLDCDEDTGGQVAAERSFRRLATFLSEFYHELLELLQRERVSTVSVFPDPQPTLSRFIASTLSSVHPSAVQRLSSLSNHYGDRALTELLTAFRATEDLAVAVSKIMESLGLSSLFSAPPASPMEEKEGSGGGLQRTHSRRRSNRMSISRRMFRQGTGGFLANEGDQPSSLDRTWEEALFEPFLDYQSDYATLEKKLLHNQLSSLVSSGSSSAGGARVFREQCAHLFTIAEESMGRCMTFTHGFGAVGLIEALDNVFETFLSSARKELIKSPSSRSDTKSRRDAHEEEFVDLDYSAEDYDAFQLSLHLLDAGRYMLDRVMKLEARIRTDLNQTAKAMTMMKKEPNGLHFPNATRGEVDLLQGSLLNSTKLHELLCVVDPEYQQLSQALPTAQEPLSASSGVFTIQQQQSSASSITAPLLLGARRAVSEFAKACQTFLQDTILSPLFKHLETYPGSNVWSEVGDTKAKRTGAGGVNELVIPTFSLSPTQTIQRVAEGLLNLPRLFEVYADDDALAFSIETLPFVNAELLRLAVVEEGTEESREHGLEERPVHKRLPSSSLSLKSTKQVVSSKMPALTPEAVSSIWLASLALTLLSNLTTDKLPRIKNLSRKGASQLAEDLGYLIQIVKALNVEWEAVEQWRVLTALDDDEGERQWNEQRDGQDMVLKTVARLRGWRTG